MKHLLLAAAFALIAFTPASAAPKIGDVAPDFSATAALAGKEFHFSLTDALKQGPVVVYFYPQAFTSGCSIEAHLFATNIDRYKALGASVIGVSGDDIAVLDKFSTADCQSKFPVASDADQSIMNAYGAGDGSGYADRISLVIVPDNGHGKILYTYRNDDPDLHVAKTISAVQDWKTRQK